MNTKPTLSELGLDSPAPPPRSTKTWQDIANEVDDTPSDQSQQAANKQPAKWNGVAAVMSFLIPGLGQLYKGHVIAGIAFFATTLLGYGFFILPGIVLHLLAITDAGNR